MEDFKITLIVFTMLVSLQDFSPIISPPVFMLFCSPLTCCIRVGLCDLLNMVEMMVREPSKAR